ncbi:hypothetical protein HK104_008381 [Borealophlyctis nickersoniae]|nr:hypothetical protein HK104_008381 [Borealophlyctis nickersoniae]
MPLPTIATALTAFTSIEHLYFLYLEMFTWNTPPTNRIFNLHRDPAFTNNPRSAVLAKNQGLYNGFLAAGLAWAIIHPNAVVGRELGMFFAGCVAVAGAYGAATATGKILFAQGVPGLLTFLAVWYGV